MVSRMTNSLPKLLLQLSEVAQPALLAGRQAKPYFGPAFDRLLDSGVLIEETVADCWPVCASCECDLDARPIEATGVGFLAPCPLDRRNDAVLDADDLRMFQLIPDALLNEIATRSGLPATPVVITPNVWLVDTGAADRCVFLTTAVRAVTEVGFVDLALRLAHGRGITVVVPRIPDLNRANLERAGMHVVERDDVLVINDATPLPTLDLARLVPGAEAPDLVLTRSRLSVRLFDAKRALPQRPFDLLWFLAERAKAGRALCERRVVEKGVWPTTTVARNAVADAVRDLRHQLAQFPVTTMKPEELIETRTGKGYLITLPAADIRLDP
jgi:DNA-binding winged helix-turn-helix (wHTH) protein